MYNFRLPARLLAEVTPYNSKSRSLFQYMQCAGGAILICVFLKTYIFKAFSAKGFLLSFL